MHRFRLNPLARCLATAFLTLAAGQAMAVDCQLAMSGPNLPPVELSRGTAEVTATGVINSTTSNGITVTGPATTSVIVNGQVKARLPAYTSMPAHRWRSYKLNHWRQVLDLFPVRTAVSTMPELSEKLTTLGQLAVVRASRLRARGKLPKSAIQARLPVHREPA